MPHSLSAEPLNLQQSSLRRTVSLYQTNSCLTSEQIAYGKEIIKGLTYNSQRAFRAFCSISALEFRQYQEIWSVLLHHRLSYEQVLCFEEWVDLADVELPFAIRAFKAIHTLSLDTGRVFRRLLTLPDISQQFSLEIIPVFNMFDPLQLRTMEELLTIDDMSAGKMVELIMAVNNLKGYQNSAAQAFAQIPGMDAEPFADSLPLINMLQQEDAWNARSLFFLDDITVKDGWDWLIRYFALPDDIQEEQFFTLNVQQQQELLKAMYEGGETLIWKLNNLHSITDRFGLEISTSTLMRISAEKLQQKLNTLSPAVYSRYVHEFETARNTNNRSQMIHTLRKAVSAERRHIAHTLTSGNIYILLAQGSELYDSSFRDILVPVLHRRIADRFRGNLLDFLTHVDTAGQYVADFITGCAQKGKLTTFFPDNGDLQKQILNLVTRSAFRDEPSLLLFSATMLPLFKILQPEARSHLVQQMIREVERHPPQTARLVTVILDYYRKFHSPLLNRNDIQKIDTLAKQFGTISFSRFQQTPFAEWLTDNTLSALSLFHPDDDGRQSFLSFTRRLHSSGYQISRAAGYNKAIAGSASSAEIKNRTLKAASASTAGVAALFTSMQKHGYCVTWSKTVNNRTIRQTLSIYSSRERQQKTLHYFLQSGDEMLIQRGHSYWRSDQITDPLTSLVSNHPESLYALRSKQRFLSLGSCGGVKVYTKLSNLMEGKVDILATIGTGLTGINDTYNKVFLELIAKQRSTLTWREVAGKTSFIFQSGRGQDYLHPGSLTAILHKIINDRERNGSPSTSSQKNSINQG